MMSNRLSQHNPKGIASEWVAGLDQEAKEKEIEYLRNCSTLFDKLRSIIQNKYNASSVTKDTDYDNASWAYKQAHLNGKLQALEELYKLLP